MNAACPEDVACRLETVFNRIQEQRMQDVPMLNPVLKVEAVGFRKWQELYLGVLITPWFMNLMLLPKAYGDWSDKPPGETEVHIFPSGRYEFIVAEENDIGRYQMCSLFSPMFEFEDHAAAVATAEAVMKELMVAENQDEISTRQAEIEKKWPGEDEAGAAEKAAAEEDEDAHRPTLKLQVETPMSRRDMLRGAFLDAPGQE